MTSIWQRIGNWLREATGAPNSISAQELEALRTSKEKPFILDVRSSQEFKQDGHIAGATLIPLSDLPNKLKQVPTDRTVVCVCRSGARSSTAYGILKQAGYTNIRNLSGGMMGWQSAKMPVTRK
ncbi:MAG: rhodanese-like domain-containing protein [Chloroflexota bacterium]|jgi:rhodanese-related sulfurtransferase